MFLQELNASEYGGAIMEESGLPAFIVVIAIGAVGIAVTLGMAIITWVFVLMQA